MTVQVIHAPTTMDRAVHTCTAPSANARAGSTSMVQPLAEDELALSAEVMLLTRRPPST